MGKSYDPACETLAEHFLESSARPEMKRSLAQHIQDAVEDWLECQREETPEPCTWAARAAGCTCRMGTVHSASIDPPEPIIDGWCPLHGGRDPDRENDARRDDANR